MEPQQQSETAPQPPVKKPLNVSIPAAIVTGAAIIGVAIVLAAGPKDSAPAQKKPTTANQEPTTVAADIATIRESDYVRGNADAPVAIIEYSDSDCPFCKKFHDTMQQAVAAYEGNIAWVYRHFPLEMHPNAYTEALALECTGELGGSAAFWSFADTVMNVTLNPDQKSNEALTTFAVQSGVNANLFKACMQNEEIAARVDIHIDEAKKSGARGTPFSIAVNLKTGKQVVIPGAMPLENLKQTIDSLLK